MRDIGKVVSEIGRAMASLEPDLGEQAVPPGRWFDGFWDFVVENRLRLQTGPVWEINGFTMQLPWSLLVLASAEEAYPIAEIYVFVEAKDRRPAISAPWPVSSVTIPGNGEVSQGAPDPLDRPHDRELAAAITRLGFTPRVGYWGIRCDWHRPADMSADEVCFAMRAALADAPKLLPLALNLARTA